MMHTILRGDSDAIFRGRERSAPSREHQLNEETSFGEIIHSPPPFRLQNSKPVWHTFKVWAIYCKRFNDCRTSPLKVVQRIAEVSAGGRIDGRANKQAEE
uniref:Uncharacterized protein n=1 Tax=Photinus pyralis TaxID=7054 RepID=A0A1Y1KDR3_PHOPY